MPSVWPKTIDCGHTGASLEKGRKTGVPHGEIAEGFWPPPSPGPNTVPGRPLRPGFYPGSADHPDANPCHGRVCLPPRLDHCPASPRGELRGSAERSPRETDRGRTLCRIRPLASHGTPYRYRNRAQCCDKRRHDQSGNQQRGRRRVLEYQGVFSTSSASCYRNIRVSATPDIVLHLMAQSPWRRPYQ